jgi:hypothetical protein
MELLSGRRPTEDLLELFDAHANSKAIHNALDPRVDDWVLEDVMVIVHMAIRCQDNLTSKRSTVLQVLPQLERLLGPGSGGE